MRILYGLIFALVLLVAPASAQVPNDIATAQAVAAEGYFDKCEAGEMRACSYFARLVAWRLNPNGDPASWGWLSKDGGSNVEGFADDAIVYGQGNHNVVDLVGGSGAPGARVQWGGPVERRPSNLWVAPRPLTAAELDYLKPWSGGGQPPPGPTGALWEAKHTEMLARMWLSHASADSAAFLRKVAEQFSFSFAGEVWGVKSADPSRPQSPDVIARNAGSLIGFRIVPRPSGVPPPINLVGQHFMGVSAVNHLGSGGTLPPPGPGPGPVPVPVPSAVNLQPVLDALARIEAKLEEQARQLSLVEAAADSAAKQAAAAAGGLQDTRNRVEDVLTAVDLARQQLNNPPTYAGTVLGRPLTLRPQP